MAKLNLTQNSKIEVGNYFKDKREYQFIGQEIGKSYLIRHEL